VFGYGAQVPEVAARTHVGHVRDGNEDAYAVSEHAWVVADGLGGHHGGEVASELAAQAALEALTRTGNAVEAFAAASAAVTGGAQGDPSLARMGTTLVSATLADDGTVTVAGVGDSRVYWLDGQGLQQVTVDDNEAEHLATLGAITREQARTHPGQFILTRCLLAGESDPPRPETTSLSGHGRLLLCTDGLTSEVDDVDVARLLATGTVDEAADALVTAALDGGGSDNVTVVVVDL